MKHPKNIFVCRNCKKLYECKPESGCPNCKVKKPVWIRYIRDEWITEYLCCSERTYRSKAEYNF